MASAFELISDTTLTSAAASISATVSTDYRRFRLTLYVLKDGTNGNVLLRLNSDSSAVYGDEALMASDTTVAATRDTGQTSTNLTEQGAVKASQTALATIEIEKPTASVPARMTYRMANMDTATTSAVTLNLGSAEWLNTSDLVSSIDLLVSAGNFAAGTRLLVEGAKP